MDLNKNELEFLTQHVGVYMLVHRQYYRLPSNTMEVVKVGKFTGKKLDDIDIDSDHEY